jgi:hypothetical protein
MRPAAKVSRALRGIPDALARALDWRLSLFWVVGMLIPTLLATVPIWRTLASALDNVPLSSRVARRFDMLTFEDLSTVFHRAQAPIAGAAALAVLCAALISPLLTAAMMASAADEAAFAELSFMQRAVAWYGRALRIWLLSLIPWLLVGVAWLSLSKSVADYAERAVLESKVDLASGLLLAVGALFSVLIHLSIEVGRAELVAHPDRRSVWRALRRGVENALALPLDTLLLYLVPTLISLLLAALLSLLRLRIVSATGVSFSIGVLASQLAVASLGWGRAARLFALSALYRSEP